MIFFFIITVFVIFFITVYLFNPVREKKRFLIIFFLIGISSFLLYKKSGNINAFFFHKQLEKEIQSLISNPEKFSKIQPEKIIFFFGAKA